MKQCKYYVIAIVPIVVFYLFTQKNCYAIPAFARKYQISCQVCHAPAIPRLKAFGEEFAYNGFRMTKYESPRYFIETGDDQLSLFRELPLAIRFDGHVLANFENSGNTEFAAPFILKLLSGGEISNKLSYYFYFLMNEGGSIVGIEDAFLMYRDLFKTGINFYIGQFQASDPLFKAELRYSLEEYRIYDAAPGTSSATLKYERGMMLEKSFNTGTTLQIEILNGCGIDQWTFDTDKYKNFMFRLSQQVGKKVSIGAFYYTGKEDLYSNTGPFISNIAMFGPDIKINFDDKFVFNFQYVKRTDSEVYQETDISMHNDVKTQGGFTEMIYSPKGDMSKWYLEGLYNWVASDIDDLDYQSASLLAGYLLRRNLKLVSEYTYQFSGDSHGRVSLGFVSAF
jgi:hypothetical protein